MSIDIPNGAAATCHIDVTDLQWPTLNNSPDSILALIQNDMQVDGFIIANKNLDLSALAFAATGEFSGTLNIINQSGQDCDDVDLKSSWDDSCAAHNAQDNAFAVLSVCSGTSQNTGTTNSTGGCAVTPGGQAVNQGNAKCPNGVPSVHNCGDPCWGITDDFVQYLKCLSQGGLTTIGLLAIGLVLGVVLIFGVKNRP